MYDALPHPDDFHLAQECLEEKTSALAYLQKEYREPVIAFLQSAGALPHEAREIVAELWSDCITSQTDTLPKLARYNGNCALKTFLNTVALNTLLTRRRRETKRDAIFSPTEIVAGKPESDTSFSAKDTAPKEFVEVPLLNLMREAIETAFKECPAEDFVLLQLAHTDGLRVIELAQMFRCDAGTISRRLGRAEHGINTGTLACIKATDPWLELKWEDFIELCGAASPACFGLE